MPLLLVLDDAALGVGGGGEVLVDEADGSEVEVVLVEVNVDVSIFPSEVSALADEEDTLVDEDVVDCFNSFLWSVMLFVQSSFDLRRRDDVDSCLALTVKQSVVGTTHALTKLTDSLSKLLHSLRLSASAWN